MQEMRGLEEAQRQMPAWAAEIMPHMETLAMSQHEISMLATSFYPRNEQSPKPNGVLFKQKIAVARTAMAMALMAMDELEAWADKE